MEVESYNQLTLDRVFINEIQGSDLMYRTETHIGCYAQAVVTIVKGIYIRSSGDMDGNIPTCMNVTSEL